MMDSLELLKR